MTSSRMWVLVCLLGISIFVGCGSTEVVETRRTTVYGPTITPTESTPTSTYSGSGSATYSGNVGGSGSTYAPVAPVAPVPGTQTATVVETTKSYGEPPAPTQPSWVNETRRCEGFGAIDVTRPAGQAKLMARRAASLDAKRNLLEQILGLRIDSKTVVRDMVAEQDRIDAQTSGIVKGAREVGAHFGPDTVTVTVEIPLFEVWSYVEEQHRYAE